MEDIEREGRRGLVFLRSWTHLIHAVMAFSIQKYPLHLATGQMERIVFFNDVLFLKEAAMKVKMEKRFQIQVSVEKVWEYLSDPNKVVVCVPGAKITEKVDERTYKGTVSVKIGPVMSSFTGDIHIDRLDNNKRELEIAGKGMDTKGKGSAEMKMYSRVQQIDTGKTEVISSMELSITGRMAQIGSRMIGDVNNQMFTRFTKNLERNLQTSDEADKENKGEPESETEPVRALPLLFSAVRMAMTRFFRRITGRAAKNVEM